jgi:hypothetical protein
MRQNTTAARWSESAATPLNKFNTPRFDATNRLRIRSRSGSADKIANLRDKFHDAFTGWLEIEQAA